MYTYTIQPRQDNFFWGGGGYITVNENQQTAGVEIPITTKN